MPASRPRKLLSDRNGMNTPRFVALESDSRK